MTAGEHIMWANRTSYPPTPAWPDWQSIRSKYQRLANGLANNRTSIYRNQLANRLRTSYEPLASQLDLQTVKEVYKTTSCDGQYCRIGYQLAYGQQTLSIAEGALVDGNFPLARQATPDGKNHVAAARKSIENLKKVHPASGRCAVLEDVRQKLYQATRADAPGDARHITQQLWQETLQRIQAMGIPASSGEELAGTLYNENSGVRHLDQKQITENKLSIAVNSLDGYWKFVWSDSGKKTRFQEKVFSILHPSNVISLHHKDGGYKIKSCSSGIKKAWGTFRKQNESYIGKVSSFFIILTQTRLRQS